HSSERASQAGIVTEAWSFLEALFASASLRVLNPTARHPAMLSELVAELPDLAGSLFHEAHTREHGIRSILTGDTDFHRLPFLEVVDPSALKGWRRNLRGR
ncbi:MAG: hypothetical protein ACRDXD_12680, partial [Acidimicrobiia bacterium]